MKVVAFNGSPRQNGNTAAMIKEALAVLEMEGIETEFIQLGGNLLRGCQACGVCRKKQDMRCAFDDDKMNTFIEKIREADGIIIGSPTYFADLSTETKALIDRCGYVSRSNGNFLSRKIGAAVCAVRRTGAMHVLDSINHFFLISDMVVPGSTYWNMTLSLQPGDFQKDQEGVSTIKRMAENMAWLLKRTRE
ncbi:MAG: flavodoxin family protein [Candidatus Methanomethylophilaceae archaeon]|nr:flavodoxin family protein [Candidatus Methanomethylophilaceae archaeon]